MLKCNVYQVKLNDMWYQSICMNWRSHKVQQNAINKNTDVIKAHDSSWSELRQSVTESSDMDGAHVQLE